MACFSIACFAVGTYELECSLGIVTQGNSGTNLTEGVSGFVYMHMQVCLFEEA